MFIVLFLQCVSLKFFKMSYRKNEAFISNKAFVSNKKKREENKKTSSIEPHS